MAKTAFTMDDLLSWRDALEEHCPTVPTVGEAITAPDVVSFTTMARRVGMTLRLRTSDGAQHTLNLNPFLCRRLLQCIRTTGDTGGWLSEQDTITFPLTPD